MTDPRQTAADDQYQAAGTEAATLQELCRMLLGMRRESPAGLAEQAPGLQVAWQRHMDALAGPLGRACRHVDPARPLPLVAMAWHPGMVVCAACAAGGALRPDPGTDFRCDACGEDSGPGQGFTTGQIRKGPLLWAFGLCRRCAGGSTVRPVRG